MSDLRYLVWNDEAKEGIILESLFDAVYAATGKHTTAGVSCLAEEWRELYGENGEKYPYYRGTFVDGQFLKDE